MLGTPPTPADLQAALATDRTYVRIRPTATPLRPQAVAQALRTFQPADGWADKPPTLEMLLVAPGDAQQVSYLFGIEHGREATLRRVLQTLFPHEYERTATTRSVAETLQCRNPSLGDRSVAALELQGAEARTGDWRHRLTPLAAFQEPGGERAQWPLGSVLATLARASVPVVVQTLVRPYPEWSSAHAERLHELRHKGATNGIDRLLDMLASTRPQDREPMAADQRSPRVQAEIDALDAVDPHESLAVNTRAVAFPAATATDRAARRVLAELGEALTDASGGYYRLRPVHHAPDSRGARRLAGALADRTFRAGRCGSYCPASLPLVGPAVNTRNPRIVAGPETAGTLCAVGGAAVPEPAQRALHTQSTDRLPRPLPPAELLANYRTAGFELGVPQTTDNTDAGGALSLPPQLQRRHLLIVGQTGTGKSLFALPGLVDNHDATDGATIIIEGKDGAFADDYLRAHYATHTSLENVYRFAAHERLPAAPVLDIEPAMASGLSRTQATAAVVNEFEAVLRSATPGETYDEAATSSRVIRAVVEAQFDPVHGDTRCTIIDIQETLARMDRAGTAPAVSDPQLQRTLAQVVDNSAETFREMIKAAQRRVDAVTTHGILTPLFTREEAEADTFSWREKLDEDCVILLDLSLLDSEPQRLVTLLTLSQLWTALRRRRYERRAADATGDAPLVNIHIEEAVDIAATGVLDELLREGRSYDVGVSLSVQFLGQLEHIDPLAYVEAINDTGTIIAGQTNRDAALAERLATSEVPVRDVKPRLRALDPGEWLCSLPGTFETETPPPFTIRSGPLPPGHPDGPEPLSEAQAVTCEAAIAKVDARSEAQAVAVGDAVSTTADGEPNGADTVEAGAQSSGQRPMHTTGPFTDVTPEGVGFDTERYAWYCTTCNYSPGASFDPHLLAVIECHADRDAVDRSRVPTVAVEPTLSPGERAQAPYSDAQLVFMQLLYNVRRDMYDPLEFDIVWDDMDRLTAYAGLDDEELAELITDGLVVEDTTHPHRVFSLTADGRETMSIDHREGVVHGDGVGDLSESNFHVLLVEALARACEQAFVDDPTHPGARVAPYHGVADGRLDVAVLDDDDNVIVAGEAERPNNDLLRAAPADFDTMAACDPERAIWVVPSREAGHEVIRALHNAPDGDPRVPQTYADETYLPDVAIEEPGLTDMYAIGTLREQFLDGPP